MNLLDQFINYIKLDDEKRILVSLNESLMPYLSDAESKKMLKNTLKSILGDDFRQLEIGKNIARITVAEGTEEENLSLVKTEITKNIQMAMEFMNNMNK